MTKKLQKFKIFTNNPKQGKKFKMIFTLIKLILGERFECINPFFPDVRTYNKTIEIIHVVIKF